jgi:DNA-directed RNA polymerase specialized sigma24 family protein
MSTDEALAVARLRQWAATRAALDNGKSLNIQHPGRPTGKPNTNRFDAALVRVIDFERALCTLDADEQTILVLRYRDRENDKGIASAVSWSVRKLSYMLPQARKHLASVLGRLNLL